MERKQDLDHRELQEYMEQHNIRGLFSEMLAYLVENQCEDHLQGMISFLETKKM